MKAIHFVHFHWFLHARIMKMPMHKANEKQSILSGTGRKKHRRDSVDIILNDAP